MGLFNEHPSFVSNTKTSDIHDSSVQGPPGQRGPKGDPGVGYHITSSGDYDIQNKKLTNVKYGDMNHDVMVKSQIEGYVNNNFLNRLTGGQIGGDLDMRGHTIKYLKFDKSDSAAARVAELNTKADKSDLDDYFKLDGMKAMTGNLNMNKNRILRLPDPQFADEPVTRKFLTQTNTLFYNIFLDLDGNAQMRGNIKMNDHRITGLTNPPNADDEATNKKYVNDIISKANIKPSHTPKNVFKYLMDDVNEWSTEYNVKVENFSNLTESPHSWDKRVLNITPVKDGRNYRLRLGLQMFPMKTNETYSLIVEFYNRDYKTWQRQETYVNGTGLWVKSSNTTKFQHRYGSSGDLYYTRTLIKFKKTLSTAPIFVYYTVHFDDKGGDMNTYPKDFKNQVYIVAYGIVGETDHVDSEVYDAHEAFEIDKTKMKMLVPLDMNGKQLMNVNLDLKFGNIFKIENCFVHDNHPSSQLLYKILRKRNNNTLVPFIISVPVVLVSFNIPSAFNIKLYDKAYIEIGEKITNKITRIALKNLNTILLQICKNGIKHIHFYNIGSSQFDLDVILSYM